MEIRKIGDGAYFIPSYSEQTIQSFHPLYTNQTITTREIDSELIETINVEEIKDMSVKPDFEKVQIESEEWLYKDREALESVRRGLNDAVKGLVRKVDLDNL